MSTINYMQYGLAPLEPIGFELAEPEAKPILFNVIFAAEDGRVVLRYDLPGTPGRDYIAIRRDSVVEIALIGDQLYFSRTRDAITTKEALSSYYGGLEYDGYDEKVDRYQVVRFRARFNRGGQYGTCHGFNINVDLLQPDADGTPHWIALSIDPDIKNPPPKDD